MLEKIKFKFALWLLSSAAVRREIFRVVTDDVRFDDAVADVVESAMSEIEYSDVVGLESYVEREISAIGKQDVYAEDVIGLDSYVSDRVRS